MSKTEITTTLKIIKFDTTVPVGEVIARLDLEVNKAGSGDIMANLRKITNQEEFIDVVKNTIKNDFLYFAEVPHHKLLKFADGQDKPTIILYTIGNPLVAQTILEHNPTAAYSIPPRLLILEAPSGSGTTVLYHLPSSVMRVPIGDNHPTLQTELEALDKRVEKLVIKITAE